MLDMASRVTIDLTSDDDPISSRRQLASYAGTASNIVDLTADEDVLSPRTSRGRHNPSMRWNGTMTQDNRSRVPRRRLEEPTEPENVNSHANSLLATSRGASSTSDSASSAQKKKWKSVQIATNLSAPRHHHRDSLPHSSSSKTRRDPDSGHLGASKLSSLQNRTASSMGFTTRPDALVSAQSDTPSKVISATPPISERARASGQFGDTQTTTTTSSRDSRLTSSDNVARHQPKDDFRKLANRENGNEVGAMKGSQSGSINKGGMGASTSSLQANIATGARGTNMPTMSSEIPIRKGVQQDEEYQRARDASGRDHPRDAERKSSENASKQHNLHSPTKSDGNVGAVEFLSRSNDVIGVTDRVTHERVEGPPGSGLLDETSFNIGMDNPVDGPASMSQVEDLLMNHIADLHDDHATFVKHTLPRHRRCFERYTPAKRAGSSALSGAGNHIQEESPFASMKGIQIPSATNTSKREDTMSITQEFFGASNNPNAKGLRSYLEIPVTKFQSTAVHVPPYTDYVGLRDNILTENNRKLLYWPYFAEEENEEKLGRTGLWEELDERFDMVNEHRPRRLLQAEQCRVHRPYVQEFLTELGIDWNPVLFWLLAQEKKIVEIEPACRAVVTGTSSDMSLLLKRTPHCEEDFDRGHKKWMMVLSSLVEPSAAHLALAAFACTAFLKVCRFSLWHIARQSDTAQSILSARIEQSPQDARKQSEVSYRNYACRVCTLHNCPYHGEIREESNSEGADEDAEPDADNDSVFDIPYNRKEADDSSSGSETDIINYKKLVKAIPRKHKDDTQLNGHGTGTLPKASMNFWLNKTETYMLHKRRPFYPCSHQGTCEEAHCRCFREKIACEKTCACPSGCKRRFRGCGCAKDPKIRVCAKNSKCECVQLNRECDADLCGVCGAAEVLDPVNRYNEEAVKHMCVNVHIQRNLPKRTLLGHSEVQGFGLYVGEKVKAGTYIGEYKGEVVTRGEAERRGAIYQHLKTNYLFSLNKDQEVDSTRAGNKFRFINNSCDDRIINCKPYVMLCNGVIRIGMYAERDLRVGEELFFNYGYPKDVTKGFWEKGQGPKGKRKPGGAQLVTVKSKKLSKELKVRARKPLAGSSNSLSSSKPVGSSSKPRSSSVPLVPSRSKDARRAQTQAARETQRLRREQNRKILGSHSPGRLKKRPRLGNFSASGRKMTVEEQFRQIASDHGGAESDDSDEMLLSVRPAVNTIVGGSKSVKATFEGVSEIPETSDIEAPEDDESIEDDDNGVAPAPDNNEDDASAGAQESDFELDTDDEDIRRRGSIRDARLRRLGRDESRNPRSRLRRRSPSFTPKHVTRSASRNSKKRKRDSR